MATLNNSEIRQRIDTHANWNTANPVLGNGEFAISSDKNDFKIGDGTKNWQTSQYIIANNPTVTGAATAASNAATAAGNAATAASNAYNLAAQALAASGRKEPKSNEDPYGNHSGQTIRVDDVFSNKFRNYDFESIKGDADLTLTIVTTAASRKIYDNANEIRFHFMTADANCKIVIPSATRSIGDVDGSSKILVDADGNGINVQRVADWTSISLDAYCLVEVRYINTWLVKINVQKISQ